MKKVLQKGIAGLGNRLQVLGYCVDVAEETGAELLVDWRDSAWRDKFTRYFTLKDILVSDYKPGIAEKPILPEWWESRVDAKCAKQLAHDDFARVKPADLKADWKTLVVCQYRMRHSGRVYELLDFKPVVKRAFKNLSLKDYDCWHIRDLDKSEGGYAKMLERVRRHETSRQKVVITDNLHCKKRAEMMGVFCPSVIPEPPEKGGAHHVNDPTLGEQGLTKRDINLSTVVDVLVGVNAVEFHATCEGSTYSQLIKNLRKAGK